MIDWIKKTGVELNTIVKNAANTPVPVGKTVLITGGIVVGTLLLAHKLKLVVVFG